MIYDRFFHLVGRRDLAVSVADGSDSTLGRIKCMFVVWVYL